jgi:hypothetical protein
LIPANEANPPKLPPIFAGSEVWGTNVEPAVYSLSNPNETKFPLQKEKRILETHYSICPNSFN